MEVSVKVGCNAGPSLRLRENLPAIIEIDARSPERLKSGWRRRDRLLSTAAENGSKTSIHLYSMNVKKRYLECVTERSLSWPRKSRSKREKKRERRKNKRASKWNTVNPDCDPYLVSRSLTTRLPSCVAIPGNGKGGTFIFLSLSFVSLSYSL